MQILTVSKIVRDGVVWTHLGHEGRAQTTEHSGTLVLVDLILHTSPETQILWLRKETT
jgi:hypothetical protein